MTVVINEINLQEFLHNPAGGIAQFMGQVVAPDILEQSRAYCGRDWPGGRGPFPAPGPPYLRTGDLVKGFEVQAIASPSGVEYDIVPTAIHRGVNYGLLLRDGSGKNMTGPYRFLPDSYYV